jgi:hypothetical protein
MTEFDILFNEISINIPISRIDFDNIITYLRIGRYSFLNNLTMEQSRRRIRGKDTSNIAKWVISKIKADYIDI